MQERKRKLLSVYDWQKNAITLYIHDTHKWSIKWCIMGRNARVIVAHSATRGRGKRRVTMCVIKSALALRSPYRHMVRYQFHLLIQKGWNLHLHATLHHIAKTTKRFPNKKRAATYS